MEEPLEQVSSSNIGEPTLLKKLGVWIVNMFLFSVYFLISIYFSMFILVFLVGVGIVPYNFPNTDAVIISVTLLIMAFLLHTYPRKIFLHARR